MKKKIRNRDSLATGWWARIHTQWLQAYGPDFFRKNTNINLSCKACLFTQAERARSFLWSSGTMLPLKNGIWRKMIASWWYDAVEYLVRQWHASAEDPLLPAAEAQDDSLRKPLSPGQWPKPKTMLDSVEKAGVKKYGLVQLSTSTAWLWAKKYCGFQGKLVRFFSLPESNFLQDWTNQSRLPQGGDGLWRLRIGSSRVRGWLGDF